MRDYTTSSALARVDKCTGSEALPRTDENTDRAAVGSAKHDHLDDRSKFGVDEAMRLVPAVAKRWQLDERESFFLGVWARKFEWSPPVQSFGEVALALLNDGTVQRTLGGKGKYPELEPGGRLHGLAILAGQNDIMWSAPEPLDITDPAHPKCPPGSVLWTGDYKGGTDAHVDPIDHNLQVASNAIMSAKWTGAKFVVPFVLFLTPPHGDWDVPHFEEGQARAWGPKDLALAEARVRAVLQRRRDMIARVQAGEVLDGWNEGQHCSFCPGQLSCPAKVGMLRRVAGLVPGDAPPMALTDEEAAWWATRLTQADGHLKRVREHLRERVVQTGKNIVLENGLEWGPVHSEQKRIVAHVALPIIREELGDDTLDDVTKISRSAIEDAVRVQHAATGVKRQLSKTMGRIMAKIKEGGGLAPEPMDQFKIHRPAEKLEEETDEVADEGAAA